MTRKVREFVSALAVRTSLYLLLALYGPSGSGKTYSALRLATGIVRVTGGKIFVIDTENRRAAEYADFFSFEHVDVQPPFDPESYIDAIAHCEARGASVIIIDSMSHEHEFVNAWHEAELDRMAGNDWDKRKRMNFSAWIAPKAARDKFKSAFMRVRAHVIFCFRAAKKLKIVPRQDPVDLGWMPKAPEAFLYEMSASALFMPNAKGVPSWNPAGDGEREMVKLPRAFEEIFDRYKSQPMSEDIGMAMARWAMGDSAQKTETPPQEAKPRAAGEVLRDEIAAQIAASVSHIQLDAIVAGINASVEGKKFGQKTADWLLAKVESKRATLAEGA